MHDPRADLIKAFSQAATGHQRVAVIEAAGITIANGIRQHCENRSDAEEMLDELFAGLRKRLRERDYLLNGKRREHHIGVKMPPELVDMLVEMRG